MSDASKRVVLLVFVICIASSATLSQPGNPCVGGTGATPETDPAIIEMMPIGFAVDDVGDLRLLNPLNALYQDDVREVFGIEDVGDIYLDYDPERIPRVLDVAAVEILDEGEVWRVVVTTAEPDPWFLGELLTTGQARFVLFVDVDLDYSSDVIVTTMATPAETPTMVAVNEEHIPVEGGWEIGVELFDDQFHIVIPRLIMGSHFSWILTTGFASSPEGSCAAVNNDQIRWVPIVDIVLPDWCPPFCEIEPQFETAFTINSPCQIWKEAGSIWYCGSGTPSPNPLPGTLGSQGQTGKMFQYRYCGNRRYELWCSKDWISWVDNGTDAGWYAHCPYYKGNNSTAMVDTNGDKNPEGYVHKTVDPYSTKTVEYIYHFGPPYTYQINLYRSGSVKKCKNLTLETTNPWGLPDNKCSYP